MNSSDHLPLMKDLLPELDVFIENLSGNCMSGAISTHEQFAQSVNWFFSPSMIERVEMVVHGWRKMIDSDGGITLVHIMKAMCALPFHEPYRLISATQKTVMCWAVLFHDLSKRSVSEHSDHTHGFRSAVQFVHNLPALGIPVADNQSSALRNWAGLVEGAVIPLEGQASVIQDNTKLPRIFKGLRDLTCAYPSAALVAKIILLHHSISTLDEWPQANPLDRTEIKKLVDIELLNLLEIMSLVDNDGWELFEAGNRERYRDITRNVFAQLRLVVDAST